MKMKIALIGLGMLCSLLMQAQEERKYIREGNELYYDGKLGQAEEMYDKALSVKGDLVEGLFNKGNVYFQLDSFKRAAEEFDIVAGYANDKNLKAKAYHNKGTSLMEAQEYGDAVEAFKEALRNNPNDQDTRYNLAYAMGKLKEQEQNNKDQENKDEKDEGEDKDKSQQNKDQETDPNKQDKDGKKNDKPNDPKDGENGNPNDAKKSDEKQGDEKDMPIQPREGQLTKAEAERLLDALQSEEEKVQLKLQKQEEKKQDKKKIEKDW